MLLLLDVISFKKKEKNAKQSNELIKSINTRFQYIRSIILNYIYDEPL